MIGIYFSGTGNTKYCLEKFVALYDRNIEITPLEDEGTIEKVAHHKDIIFAYPIYYSNLPKIVRKRKNSRRLVRVKCLCQTIRV